MSGDGDGDEDEVARLGAALRAATPAPDPAARARALAAAAAAFAAAAAGPASVPRAAPAQAGGAGPRPTRDRPHPAARAFGGWTMPTLTLRRGLYAGASLAVIAIAVALVQDPRVWGPRPAVVTEPEATVPPAPQPEAAAERDRAPAADRASPAATAPAPGTPAPAEARTEAAAPLAGTVGEAEAARPAEGPVAPAPREIVRKAAEAPREAAPLAAAPPAPVADAPAALPPEPRTVPEENRDRFEGRPANPLKVTAEEPVSTFSIDVDTASYSWVRARIAEGVLPDPEAVRIEELVNYFPYDYPAPGSRDVPFATSVTVMPTPWNAGTKLLHIGIRGYDLAPEARPDANLVFLIDTSGSMAAPDKLPLLLDAFRLLLGELRPTDEVAIVAYAGSAGVVLEPTKVAEREKILAALARLAAGGSTAGGEGILAAYALAEAMKAEGETTRVMLATDGDFNVGISDPDALTRLIEEKRRSGVFLSVLGFGEGNYQDALMQRLAQNGNGQAAYIDSLSEARKVLVEGVAGALFPIATDVKIQVEFNPAVVAEYRLIGYETRALAREDFANDRVDAGEIGAGHTVTALYEITPVGSPARLTEDLRYGTRTAPTSAEYGFLRLRYKLPGGEESRLIERAVTPADEGTGGEASFAAAVAGFGELLRGSKYLGDWGYDEVLALARRAVGEDPWGYRTEFLALVRDAGTLARLRRP